MSLNPIGVVIDAEPRVRQVVPPFQKNGAVCLGCSIARGTRVHFMKPKQSLTEHLAEELGRMRKELGPLHGALLFDCALRRIELEASDGLQDYAHLIDFPAAGFHTHGESWLGHMHQTLTGLFFG